MCSSPSCGMLTNSGMLTARLAAVEFSMRMAGLSLPSSSMWVRNICVYGERLLDRKSTRLNSSHLGNSYAVFCLKKKRHLMRARISAALSVLHYTSSITHSILHQHLFLTDQGPPDKVALTQPDLLHF